MALQRKIEEMHIPSNVKSVQMQREQVKRTPRKDGHSHCIMFMFQL